MNNERTHHLNTHHLNTLVEPSIVISCEYHFLEVPNIPSRRVLSVIKCFHIRPDPCSGDLDTSLGKAVYTWFV